MLLATSNKAKQLLCLSYIQRIQAEEIRHGYEDIKVLLADMAPGYRVLADLTQVTTFDMDCASEIGRLMELTSQAGVALIVRVIPDPDKDIGLNILAAFHHKRCLRTVTCKTLADAITALAL
jgi:PIN domain nuclease of toxin-antitoxin system